MSQESTPSSTGSSNKSGSSRSVETHALFDLMSRGIPPRLLLRHLAPSLRLPQDADDMMLWSLLISTLEPPKRKKLPQYNTINDAIDLINKSKKILVLSGAGISTSAGLPDFRSRNGIYVTIHAEHPDLEDPKLMFDINYFKKNPLPFYQFAKALYPGQYSPTVGHKFIKCIEEHDKLLRNYSQNIDTLEKLAGIDKVIECHGSFAKATCTNCRYCVDGDSIRDQILSQKIPNCPKCIDSKEEGALAVMKPNIVFFGEQLGENFHSSLDADKDQADLLIVIGSSLKVRPVALIPDSIPANVPQILINKEHLDHMNFDIELLGDCDDILQELCLRLGGKWAEICKPNTTPLIEIDGALTLRPLEPEGIEIYKPIDVIEKKDSSQIDDEDEVSSFKSNQAIVASECTEQNMIEELDEIEEDANNDADAISNADQKSDDDWEDIEVLESSSDSFVDISKEKADLELTRSSYIFLKPNKYLFYGAELTRAQYRKMTKRLISIGEDGKEM